MNCSFTNSARSWNHFIYFALAILSVVTLGTITPERAIADKPNTQQASSHSPRSYPSTYPSNRGSYSVSKFKAGTRFHYGSGLTGGRPGSRRHGTNHLVSGLGLHLNLSPYSFGHSFSYRGNSSLYQPSYRDFSTNESPSFYPSQPELDTYSGPVYDGTSNYPLTQNYTLPNESFPSILGDGSILTLPEAAAREDMLNGSTLQTLANSQPYYSKIPTSASARSFQSRAEQAFKNADYQQAAKLAEQALAQDPKNNKLRLFVSHTDFAVGNYTKAVHHLDQATHAMPTEQWGEVIHNFREFYGKNDYVTQTDRLNQDIASRPTATSLALRGFHYGCLGYAEAATVDFQHALGIDSSHALAKRLLPVLGIAPVPLAPEEIQAPIPVALPIYNSTGSISHGQSIYRSPDGIIRLIPQFTDAELEAAVPVETGKSILLDGPAK